MKTCRSIVMLVAILTLVACSSNPVRAATMYGDANENGAITAADVTKVLQYVEGLTTLTAQGYINADVTGNGQVTEEDAIHILRKVVNSNYVFPIAE